MKNSNPKQLFWSLLMAGVGTVSALAQSTLNFYNSGSTGADGPFYPQVTVVGNSNQLSGVNIPGARAIQDSFGGTTVYYIDVPLRTNGLYNFTTITIPLNMRVRFVLSSNQLDSPPPVIFLATGDVTIAGEIGLTSKDTAAAYVGGSSYYADNDGYDGTGPRWIPGPGGFRGGQVDGDSGLGTQAGIYRSRAGGSESFCLPLVGGSGASYCTDYLPSYNYHGIGSGGSGVFYLSSSTKITFDSNYGATSRGIMFRYSFYNWNGGSYSQPGGTGMAALFANQIFGTPRTSDNTRTLFSACQQQVVQGSSIYPMWSTGIYGNNVPVNPSVNITLVGTNAIPLTNTSNTIYPMPSPGSYAVTVTTQNLPTNIVFNVTSYLLNMDQSYNGTANTYVTPPTTPNGDGTSSAIVNVTISSGYQYLVARAKNAITVAMAPDYQGSPIKECQWATDQNGNTHTTYVTASGAMLSQEAAMRLAVEQGKWDFVRTYGGQISWKWSKS